MAGNVNNTLYPPIADTFMPAFVNEESAIISFTLSPYNNVEKITRIHISLIDQKTNQYVLEDYISTEKQVYIINGIMIMDFQNSASIDDEEGLYHIEIPASYLMTEVDEKGNVLPKAFKTETWYQAQVRLDSSSASITNVQQVNDYLLQQRKFFSEWSNVILLRAIPRPILSFKNWDISWDSDSYKPIKQTGSDGTEYWAYPQTDDNDDLLPGFNQGLIPIAATVDWYSAMEYTDTTKEEEETVPAKYQKEENTEYLDSYEIIITKQGQEEPFLRTGTLYVGTGQKDTIYYLADMNNADQNSIYVVRVNATTRNGYKWYTEKLIEIAKFMVTDFGVEWNFTTIKLNAYNDESEKVVTEEDGFVSCTIKSLYTMEEPGYLYIFRSSSVDNYTKNEILKVVEVKDKFEVSFEDKTVSSLISYRYKVQYHFKKGPWTKVLKSNIIYPDFYDMLLLRQDKQLAIRFDQQINSLKPIVNRVKIDTLGNKYPRFVENARMNYKQFQISGYISSEQDFNRKFLNEKDEIYKDTLDAYDYHIGNEWLVRNDTILESTEKPTKNGFHDTYLHDNWYWEREFREQAVAWLNNGEPKLFRSMTEGNMIVMLTDISLTPNRTLGRRLYQFSATMYEIADGNDLKSLHDYGIITIQNDEEDRYKNKSIWEEDDEEEEKTEVVRLGQYILSGKKYLSIKDLITGSNLKIKDSYDGAEVEVITIKDKLDSYYSGIYKNRFLKDGSIKLHDLKIQFTSKPLWWKETANNGWTQVIPDENFPDEEKEKLWFGYIFKIEFYKKKDNNTISAAGRDYRDIFVNQKGYYQIPSDIDITGLVFYDNETYQLDYIYSYFLGYTRDSMPKTVKKVKDIIGQDKGLYYPDTSIKNDIYSKYHIYNYNIGQLESEELMETLDAVSFDVTPYALVNLAANKNATPETRLIGQTGVYNLMTSDFETYDITFLGRRMTLAKNDNRPYLDEWEYRLSDSVFNEEIQDENYESYWYDIVVSSDPIESDDLVLWWLPGMRDDEKLPPAKYWRNCDDSQSEEDLYGYAKISNIKNPQYNTVYKLISEERGAPLYVIYYGDQGWYRMVFEKENDQIDFSQAIAKVPIYGMINYRGTVIKKFYT